MRVAPPYAAQVYIHNQDIENLAVVLVDEMPLHAQERAMKRTKIYIDRLGGPRATWPRA